MQMLGFGFGGFDLTHMEIGLVFWLFALPDEAFCFVVVIVVVVLVGGDICIGLTVTDWTPIIVDNHHDMIMSSVLVLLLAKRQQVVGRAFANKQISILCLKLVTADITLNYEAAVEANCVVNCPWENFELLCHCDCPVKTKSVCLVTTAHIWFGPIVVMRSDKRSDGCSRGFGSKNFY